MKFGQAASDYVPQDASGEVWIRSFKDPATQIRIAPASMENESGHIVHGTAAWPTEREHYEASIGSFPCAERFGVKCVGCTDPDEKVQQRGRKYYVNAVDEKGQLRVFKFGVNLYKTFKAREQRALSNDPDSKQPLSDRDYIINKMGKGLDTTYDPEPGDRYRVDFPDKLHDIQQILTDRYSAAEAAYAGTAPDNGNDEQETKSDKSADNPTDEFKKADPKSNGFGTGATYPSYEEIEAADSSEIKGWLDRMKVEYPQRIARARLVGLAKETTDKPPY